MLWWLVVAPALPPTEMRSAVWPVAVWPEGEPRLATGLATQLSLEVRLWLAPPQALSAAAVRLAARQSDLRLATWPESRQAEARLEGMRLPLVPRPKVGWLEVALSATRWSPAVSRLAARSQVWPPEFRSPQAESRSEA
ncbi:hypothetical protein [Fodinicola acaciae]|uniref:hypothetical protein n=1 Tax=Fodinicola acaciae TaxID=2681555 RepID=UPI0013D8C44F|nr:hypothetical protein [Fodinicola acaciae]